MKTIIQLFATFLLFLMLGYSTAQVPEAFNYQAVARNAAGNVLPDQALGVRISLHEGSESGDVVYSETFTPTTNEFGLFTLAIGTGTPVTGVFSDIDWSDYQYWLQVEMDMSGGTSYANMGASKLLSVPYAMHSASSVWKKSGTSINYVDGMVGVGTVSPVAVLDVTRSNTLTNSQLWLSQKGTGDATVGFQTPGTNWSIGIDQSDAGKLKIGNSYDASVNTQMTFSSGGNVAIGTESPNLSTKLHVETTGPVGGYFTTNYTSGGTYALFGQYLGTSSIDGIGVMGISTPTDYYGIGGYFNGGYIGSYGVSQGSSYNIYYGSYGAATTSGAGYAIGVFGSASASSGVAYGLYCSGNGGYTGTWSNVSDAKFKSNIAGYSAKTIDKIMLLKPVSYTMKTAEYPFMGFSSGTQIGFIAQDVKSVFPSLVEKGVHPGATKTDPLIEYEALNYIGMIPILVKAIQEQQQEIELLREEIELLKNK